MPQQQRMANRERRASDVHQDTRLDDAFCLHLAPFRLSTGQHSPAHFSLATPETLLTSVHLHHSLLVCLLPLALLCPLSPLHFRLDILMSLKLLPLQASFFCLTILQTFARHGMRDTAIIYGVFPACLNLN
jgi:hypothetical protein